MCEKKSKYHIRSFVGKKTGDVEVDEFGYKYFWNSSHEELEPSTTFKVENNFYCVYCREKAYPIQAGLRGYEKDYTTTGYTCICESSETEKLFKKELEQMEREHRKEIRELQRKYMSDLTIDKVKILELKQQAELKTERWRNKNTVENYFTSVNGNPTYY